MVEQLEGFIWIGGFKVRAYLFKRVWVLDQVLKEIKGSIKEKAEIIVRDGTSTDSAPLISLGISV